MVSIIPPHSPEDREALRQSIAEHGVLTPILIDAEQRILDGHTRAELADELGKRCPKQMLSPETEDERLVIELATNFTRRHLTKEQRTRIIERLRGEWQWSDRRIADTLGLDRSTVSSTGGNQPVDRRVGLDGRNRPTRRTTSSEITRRRKAVQDLSNQGYSRAAIVSALDSSDGTVSKDAAALGISFSNRGPVTTPGPAPKVEWRDKPAKRRRQLTPPAPPPPTDDTPMYQMSYVLNVLEALEEDFRRNNCENRLAHDAEDAIRAEDEAWFARARYAVGVVKSRLDTLQQVLDDPAERTRRQAMVNETDDRPTLRVVGG